MLIDNIPFFKKAIKGFLAANLGICSVSSRYYVYHSYINIIDEDAETRDIGVPTHIENEETSLISYAGGRFILRKLFNHLNSHSTIRILKTSFSDKGKEIYRNVLTFFK